jgi:hypothetical protein
MKRLSILVIAAMIVTQVVSCGLDTNPASTLTPAVNQGQSVKESSTSRFEVISLDIDPPVILCGIKASVIAKIANRSEIGGAYRAVLTLDGAEIAKKDLAIGPGATMSVTFAISKDQEGTYALQLENITRNLIVQKVPSGTYIEKIYSVPHYMENDKAYGGFPIEENRVGYCVPVSISNYIIWLSDNGFPNLAPHSGDRKKDQYDVISLLSSSDYLKTDQRTGVTKLLDFLRGLKKYVLEKGYSYNTIAAQGTVIQILRQPDREFDSGQIVPNLDFARKGVQGGGCVWLEIGEYKYNSAADEYSFVRGHLVTLVGFGYDGKSSNEDYLIAHDGLFLATSAYGNEYILPVRINSGTLTDGPGYTHSASGFYRMKGVAPVEAGQLYVPILENIFLLEMRKP